VRQIVLDTETTGLEPGHGHRIIELAGVELMNRRLTGNRFHRYLNPERESDAAALQIHGLNSEFLRDQPKFAEIAGEFLDYIAGAELVIHNAPFDVAFLNQELSLCRVEPIAEHCPSVIDTLVMAKDLHPGKRNSLDAICERYGIDHSRRTLHGALLDAQLLAEAYLAMTRGQESLMMDLSVGADVVPTGARGEHVLIVLHAGEDELLEHARVLAGIDKEAACVWHALAAA
jgi:DNA polymerase III subunit epsilon